jgi:hypothetical protein
LPSITATDPWPARQNRAGFFLSGAIAALLGAAAASAQQAPTEAPGMRGTGQPENTGPNKNLVRFSAGTTTRRGAREDWWLLDHPDGSRTLVAAGIGGRRGSTASSIVRVDERNQPLVVYQRHRLAGSSASTAFRRDAWPALDRNTSPAVTALRAGRMPDASRRVPPSPTALSRAGVARWAMGRYRYGTLQDDRLRGTEDFHLTVHRDGARSLLIWHDFLARHSQFSVALNLDDRGRPLEAFVSYWNAAGYKGSTIIQVDGPSLGAQTRGAAGEHQHQIEAPARFSIGTHPVAGDGWHTFHCDAEPGQKATSTVYTMEAGTDTSKPMLGQLTTLDCENLGREPVTVPAGSFDTLHYRLAGVSDIWITPEDRLMVKFISPRFDRSYVPTDFYSEGFTQNQVRR